jgi:hypothetical protein
MVSGCLDSVANGLTPPAEAGGASGARLIGHTTFQLPHGVRRFILTSPANDSEIGGMYMHEEMALHPYRTAEALILARQLMEPDAERHIPEFRPLAH